MENAQDVDAQFGQTSIMSRVLLPSGESPVVRPEPSGCRAGPATAALPLPNPTIQGCLGRLDSTRLSSHTYVKVELYNNLMKKVLVLPSFCQGQGSGELRVLSPEPACLSSNPSSATC